METGNPRLEGDCGKMRKKGAATRTALVTGGSSGLGFELARLFARDGYHVVLAARDEGRLAQAKHALEREYGAEVETFSVDLSTDGAVERLCAFVDSLGVEVDALVNNAGFGIAAPFAESDWERQQALLRTNVEALTELCRVFGGRMAARREGRVLNVASLAAFMPGPYLATYYASKAYVQSFTQALHTELHPSGVHVTTLCPGPVRTEFFPNAGFSRSSVFVRAALPAPYVARVGYLALRANKTQVTPGLFAKVATLFTRVAPRSLMRLITCALQKPTAKRFSDTAGISNQ